MRAERNRCDKQCGSTRQRLTERRNVTFISKYASTKLPVSEQDPAYHSTTIVFVRLVTLEMRFRYAIETLSQT